MSSKKHSFYRKRNQLREKHRKPILVVVLPRVVGSEMIASFISDLKQTGIEKDYYLIPVAGDEFEVEVHGATRLTSFDISELRNFLADKMISYVQ